MLNTPPPGTPPMASVADCAVLEGQAGTATLHFQVTLDRPAEGWGASFLWAVTDGTATLADNDYQPSSGTLVFANGESSKTISITVNSDTAFESLEKLTLTLASPQNAVLFRAQATGSILN
ncbi:MAG: Calx-beta domain-containing protein, partial [bacterium]